MTPSADSIPCLGATAVLFGVNKDLKALLAMMKIEKLYKIADTASQLQSICGR